MYETQTPPTATDVVLELYAAVLGGDGGRASDLVTPDVRMHVPGTHELAGEHVGLPAILEFVDRSRRTTDDGEHIEVLDVLAGRDHVALYCHVSATRTGRSPLDNSTIHLARVSDGRVSELTIHNRDDRPVDAFWS